MRDYSDPSDVQPAASACNELDEALRQLGAARLVMGHTPQDRINCACGGKAWRIDVGLSRAMGGGVPEALEISRGGEVRVLTRRGTPAAARERIAQTPRFA